VKIAFIGTHGVGKTTLCFDLAARLKRMDRSVDLVKETARDCPLPINQDTTYDAQAWILHTQIARELEAVSRHDIVVCDRSVLDNYAYLVHKLGPRRELEPLVEKWIRTYALLVKVPIWQPPRFDGVRAVAETFQRGIDATIDELVRRFGLDVLELTGDDPDAWTTAVIQRLQLAPSMTQEDLFPPPDR
jgi:nicotinamide riboside kinase